MESINLVEKTAVVGNDFLKQKLINLVEKWAQMSEPFSAALLFARVRVHAKLQ